MNNKQKERLSNLGIELENIRISLNRLYAEKHNIDAKINRKKYAFKKIEEKIKNIRSEAQEIDVSPEAMLSYLLQKFQVTEGEIRKEMLPENLEKKVLENGDGVYNNASFLVEARKGRVIRVTQKKGEKIEI